MRNPILTFVLGLLIGLAAAAGAYFAGNSQGQAQATNQQQQFFLDRGGAAAGGGTLPGGAGGRGAGGAGGLAGGFAAGGGVTGVISTVNGSTLTLTTPRDGEITVSLADSVPVLKMVSGAAGDLKVGQRIVVRGERSGNNVAAAAIQIADTPEGVVLPTQPPRPNRTPAPLP